VRLAFIKNYDAKGLTERICHVLSVDTKTNNTQERAAYSLKEFADKFGKERSWAYRQIKAGKLKPITGFGSMMIPASEIDRLAGGKVGAA
jgi:predicted DNA-binding transcriptional regulator AlpA